MAAATFLTCGQAQAQVAARNSAFTTAENKARFQQYLADTTIALALAQPMHKIVESQWRGAFWAMELTGLRNDTIAAKFRYLLRRYEHYTEGFRRPLLEATYALYPYQFQTEIAAIAYRETNSKRFALCMAYLLQNTANAQQKQQLLQTIETNFPGWAGDPILFSLHRHIAGTAFQLPPFRALHDFFKGKKIIYSFQRPNRNYAGLAIVQQANGSFVTDSTGKVKMFEQFARASSNLPYYITNGNTPQGLMAIEDTATSENSFIGPTPNFQTRLPYECSVSVFYHGRDSSAWSLEKYHALLPLVWQTPAMEQAFYAGKAGRTEIIAHGTCINPAYYKDEPYYPFTPSMGCLTGKEIWNEDGTIQYSAQLALMNAWLSTPEVKGYLIVIDLADKKQTVQRGEVEALLNGLF